MSKMKEMISDWRYVKICLYIVFTATLLYIVYRIVANFTSVLSILGNVLSSLFTAFTPLIIGLILAYILSPLVDLIDKKVMTKVFFRMPSDPIQQERRINVRRTVSILITFILILAAICIIIYAFAVLIVGQLFFSSLQSMIDSITSYFQQYQGVIKQLAVVIPTSGLEDKLQDILNSVINWFGANFNATAIINYITGFGGSVLNIVLGIVVSIYLIKDRDYFKRLWRKTLHLILPQKANGIVTETLNDINVVLSRFLRGQLLDALIIAVLSSIALTAIGVDFGVFIGCFAGIANVIPYFGPIIGMIPAAIVGLLTEGIGQAVLAVVVLFILQQIDGNLIYPKIVGSSIGLHPIFVLIGVTVGGYYFGIIGMLLAVPVTAILKCLLMKHINLTDRDAT